MKTYEIVTTSKGWRVTRRYCGRNQGAEFFAFGTKKKDRKLAEQARDQYIAEWMGK